MTLYSESLDEGATLPTFSRTFSLPKYATSQESIVPKTLLRRNRTESLPSLYTTDLRKSYSTSQGNSFTEKEKITIRSKIWKDRVINDDHFPVKIFSSCRNKTACDESSAKSKRSSEAPSKPVGRRRRYSEDLNGCDYDSLMEGSPSTLIRCISSILCSYLIERSSDPNNHSCNFSRNASPNDLPIPPSNRSKAPASPSIFNMADPRCYPADFAFVPPCFGNDMYNDDSCKVEVGDDNIFPSKRTFTTSIDSKRVDGRVEVSKCIF